MVSKFNDLLGTEDTKVSQDIHASQDTKVSQVPQVRQVTEVGQDTKVSQVPFFFLSMLISYLTYEILYS